MGIDVYLSWPDMLAEDFMEQVMTGFDVTKGNLGYLREAYHGGPYGTHVLVPEAFEEGNDLGEDLPTAFWEHVHQAPDHTDPRDVGRQAAAAVDLAPGACYHGTPIPARLLRERLADTLATVQHRYDLVYPGETEEMQAACQAFQAFVVLAEAQEARTGQPCRILASW